MSLCFMSAVLATLPVKNIKVIAHNKDEEGDNNFRNKREDVTLKNKQQTLKSGLNGAHNE